ncbi:hypothetical protein NQ317_002577 [Molorchus minor]|uniref:Uncharacterized protein n=1 Tax=Molorchus minor TaxID=1323400 RepID=A0ABQ9JVL1_9CUCU|nr:hypothetical protein NQ317_002577 [Molorchus minor]
MKSCNSENSCPQNEYSEKVTDSLITKGYKPLKDRLSLVRGGNCFKITSLGEKWKGYECISPNNNDIRSQSLPDCLDENTKANYTEACDIHDKLICNTSPTHSPTNEWFKTWPERCDKLKGDRDDSSDSVVEIKTQNTHTKSQTCDMKNNSKNTISLNEALQNISLAYSPVTKQLHLVEKPVDKSNENIETPDNNKTFNKDLDCDILPVESDICLKRSKHKRTEAGSFSSTVSTLSGLSNPSTSGVY